MYLVLLTAACSCFRSSFGYTYTLHRLNTLPLLHPRARARSTLSFSKSFLSLSSSHFMCKDDSDNIAPPQPKPSTLMEAMSQACSQSLSRPVQLEPTRGGGASGGGGASVSAAVDTLTGTKYFVKKTSVNGGGAEMLHAEFLGVQEMSLTHTIKVPTPVAFGTYDGLPSPMAFCVFEYLEMGGGGSQFELGVQLAKLHKNTSSNSKFGFSVDNTIGATPQPNTWKDTWVEFWDSERLGHMLSLTGNAGLDNAKVQALRHKTKEILSEQTVVPSLIHGDLWGGNKGFAREGGDGAGTMVPVIFDPATYYGDREADIAMTYLFGGFSPDFYEGYETEWPLLPGHEKRRTVYNLYHILNHDVLFGGMYLRQAQGMIDQILRM